ncbi:GntR family transcriptional regulator [Siculibacillus lacustris]|uniref:GntR family transcriptional regulator n=1 Tax=Siculibacillus lacustris TaxID=1549641 RepID=A0A4Q9VNS6_9HYPH|nr:GntR family transcriptional regulator [Siculibacillus lacustris]TBW37353.1 GntR family transcriptional regulator [Siculibacillus lacustris]
MPRTRDPFRSARRDDGAPRPQPRVARIRAGITHTERLRTELADDIACARLAPGTALDETQLAERFGVSRTPVREALRELTAMGLVESRPHRGAVVAEVDAARLDQMFTVMAEFEALCAGLAATAMTAIERTALDDMHIAAAELVRIGDLAGYTAANDRFHTFVYAATHNGFLAETVLGVRRRVNAFRRAQFHNLGRLAVSHGEHDRVVQAMLRGDREAAAREMRAHLESSRHSYGILRDRH